MEIVSVTGSLAAIGSDPRLALLQLTEDRQVYQLPASSGTVHVQIPASVWANRLDKVGRLVAHQPVAEGRGDDAHTRRHIGRIDTARSEFPPSIGGRLGRIAILQGPFAHCRKRIHRLF